MEKKSHHKLIILGSGPAGYTAAIYAKRANIDTAIITGLETGGQLMTTTDVDNWPGDPSGLTGPALMERMQAHAERYETQMIFDQIHSVAIEKSPFVLQGDYGTYTCDACIIATGASARYLGLASEKTFQGKGVSACATCDGFFYKDQSVLVVGGGNTAVEEALYLSNIAKTVTLVHRRNQLRAEKILINKLLSKSAPAGNIHLVWEHTLSEIVGTESGVTGAILQNVHTHDTHTVNAQGVFIAIGHDPNTKMFTDKLDMNPSGYLTLHTHNGGATATSIPGIFAAGDVADPTYRQAITSAASGCMAALDAEKYLDQV